MPVVNWYTMLEVEFNILSGERDGATLTDTHKTDTHHYGDGDGEREK